MVGPMARPGARGLGPGLGLKYEIVLRAGPGLDIIVAGRAGLGPQIMFAGRAWISGPCRALVYKPVSLHYS